MDEGTLPDETTAAAVSLRCFDPLEAMVGLPLPIPSPRALVKLARAVRAADTVVIHDALYLTSIAALILAKYHRRRSVLIQHIAGVQLANPALRLAFALANRLIARAMIASADEVVFISDTVRQAFARVRRQPPPQLLFNGVDTTIFRPARTLADRAAARAEFGLGSEPFLLFVGRFVEKKGLAILHELARTQPSRRFVLAGQGPIDPDSWGLPNVTVVRGCSGADIAALYSAADALVLPSVGEGYPLVVQEALATGLPVVCGAETSRADPAANRWLTGVEIALTDPAGSARRVAAAIAALRHDEGAAAASRDYARSAYSWTAMARSIVALAHPAGLTTHPAAAAAARNCAV